MSGAFTVGAEFVLGDKFTPELRRLTEGLEGASKLTTELQAKFDKLGLGGAVAKIKSEWEEIARISSTGASEVLKSMTGIGADSGKIFGDMTAGAKAAIGEIGVAASGLKDDVVATMGGLTSGSIEALKGIGTAAPELFSPIVGAARSAATETEAIMRGVAGSVDAPAAKMRASSAASAIANAGSGMAPRAANGNHSGGGGGHGGFHFRPHGMSVPGGHLGVSQGGDGMVPLVSGLVVGELLKHATEAAMEMRHWTSQFQGAGFSGSDINQSQAAAWANAGSNMNASVTDSMRMILELNKATGNLQESMHLLPQFSTAEMVMQSVKAEGLHSHFNGEGQVLNFAKALEEMGATQKGATPEEREANTRLYAREALQTMIASRGLTDGNSLFALTNNSGGAAQNWDVRMATTVAPLLGDIMKHSKLGNADYMAVKSYAGGGITSKAVQGLINAGLVDDDLKSGKVYQDKQGWHLDPNSKFAEGMTENIFDWSRRQLDVLQEHGHDTHSQKAMNEIINGIGSNKSTTMMMRALLEPGTRSQLTKEMVLRDKVPEDAASILQNNDPVLKLDALSKKWNDFLNALGGPLVDPAMAALTRLTSIISSLAQVMSAHPDLTKFGAETAGIGGLGLLGYGGAKMLGFGGDSGLGAAATQLDASALALKEAAAALGGGHGGVPPGSSVPPTNSKPGIGSLFYPYALYQAGKAAIDSAVPWMFGHTQEQHEKAQSYNPWDHPILGGFVSSAQAASNDNGVKNFDGNALHRGDEAPAASQSLWHRLFGAASDPAAAAGQKFGQLNASTGFVLTSFDTLNTGSASLGSKFAELTTGSGGFKNSLDILTATAMRAARALAEVALSQGGGVGGSGGGGGFTNASYTTYGGDAPAGRSLPSIRYGRPHAGVEGSLLDGPVARFGAGSTFGQKSPEVMSRLMSDFGLDAPMAAKILGNLGHESQGFKAFNEIGGGGGIGWAQWTGSRNRDFMAWSAANHLDPHSDEANYGFLKHELSGRYKSSIAGLKAGGSLEGFEQSFEAAGVKAYGSRHAYERAALDAYNKRSVPVAGPPPQSKTITPGRPAGKQVTPMIQARFEVPVHLDGQKVAHHVVNHMVAAMEHPDAIGSADGYGTHQGPGTAYNDAA